MTTHIRRLDAEAARTRQELAKTKHKRNLLALRLTEHPGDAKLAAELATLKSRIAEHQARLDDLVAARAGAAELDGRAVRAAAREQREQAAAEGIKLMREVAAVDARIEGEWLKQGAALFAERERLVEQAHDRLSCAGQACYADDLDGWLRDAGMINARGAAGSALEPFVKGLHEAGLFVIGLPAHHLARELRLSGTPTLSMAESTAVATDSLAGWIKRMLESKAKRDAARDAEVEARFSAAEGADQ